MRADAAAFYRRLRDAGVPARWTHMQGDEQWCARKPSGCFYLAWCWRLVVLGKQMINLATKRLTISHHLSNTPP